jgi:hypothetical protein
MNWPGMLLQAIVACLVALQTAHAREEILRFHSDIDVLADSSMVVKETIRVRAEGEQIRRGIYREFPTDYRDRLNNRVKLDFQVLEVTRDGQSEPFFTENHANGVRVYVGSANRYLPPAEYEYAITYRTARQLGYFDDHDELYWNVTGNGWGFAIQNASATIRLPGGVARGAMAIEGYTGAYGARGQDYTARIVAGSEAFIATTRPLQPHEGLTVVASWPKGVVAEPSAMDRAGFLLADNGGLIIALCGLGLMAAYLYFAWSRYGRDPEAGPVFPHYEPPPKLSPGACRYVRRMSHDHQAFSAAVLNLAVKGYLTIHEGRTEALQAATGGSVLDKAADKLSPMQKKLFGPLLELAEQALEAAADDTFVLQKNADSTDLPELGPGEEALLKNLFVSGQYLVLTNSNHEVVSAAIKAHAAALKKYYQRIYFLTNAGLLLPALLIGLVTVLVTVALAELTPLAIFVLLLALPLIFWFGYLMKAPTVLGRRTMDQIDGFKMYLTVAEADDLQRIEGIAGASPVKTPELFERYLPFAVALDVEQPWADQFERLFMRISAEQATGYRPGWYVGQRPIRSFSSFTTTMTSSLTTAISSSSAAPGSSSGSGGGGSSGGGGGGGGGGGW